MNIKNQSIIENEKNFYELNEDNELDLIELFKSFIRNKFIILPFLLIFAGYGLFESNKRKDIWLGQFRIVLDNAEKSQAGLEGLERLSAFMTNAPTSNLRTEVEILKSPSVLMPVLDFVKQEKKIKGNDIDKLSYRNWLRNSLTVDLEDSTSILNIGYRDTDKDLILLVLEKISEIYQEYSTKKMKSNIFYQKEYLKNQIKKFASNTQNSIVDLQKYSDEYDILLPKFKELDFKINGDSNQLNNYLLLMNPDNDIKYKIEETKDRINFLKTNQDQSSLLILAKKLESEKVYNSPLINQLDEIEIKIEKNNSIFKQDDPLILNFKSAKKSILEKIKIQILNALNSQLLSYESILRNNTKSKEVISEFRNLFGNALRNSVTLQSLEKELHLTSLEEARTEMPWKLITNPTLLGAPVGPLRLGIFMRQFFIGLFIGSFASILFDLKKNVIYSENKLRKKVNLKLIEKLTSSKINNWSEDIEILFNGFIKVNKYETLSIIYLGNINDIYIEKVNKEFQKYFVKSNFLITNDLLKSKDFKNVLLLIAKGNISNGELTKQLNRISLQDMNLIGWILID
tara:strand:+ start:45109 stop:46824 length:1716 start_codon:yes stop_codon:yes gene_type:complete